MKIDGKMHYLWRAVDHEGEVLEPFATNERDKKAALKFMKTYGEQRLVAVGLTAPPGSPANLSPSGATLHKLRNLRLN